MHCCLHTNLTVCMFCICCQQLRRHMPAHLAPWRVSPRVFRSSKSELKPNLASDGLVCAPLQTFTEEEAMLKDMGSCYLCS